MVGVNAPSPPPPWGRTCFAQEWLERCDGGRSKTLATVILTVYMREVDCSSRGP